MTRTCAFRPARPLSAAPCPLEPASMCWETWTQVSKGASEDNGLPSGDVALRLRVLTRSLCESRFFSSHRDQLRLHPGVPPQHRHVAPHQAHAARRPLQNGLRRPAHRQLSTVPPPAEPGPVPDQSVIRCDYLLPGLTLGILPTLARSNCDTTKHKLFYLFLFFLTSVYFSVISWCCFFNSYVMFTRGGVYLVAW